jgi:MoxR-like ATPase
LGFPLSSLGPRDSCVDMLDLHWTCRRSAQRQILDAQLKWQGDHSDGPVMGNPVRTAEVDSSLETPLKGHDALIVVRDELRDALKGKEEVIELSLAAFLARGHLLLEGPPGTGKTSLAKAIAQAFGGSFRRVQMTSDLLPSDVVGVLRLRPGGDEFEFRKGPIFANVLLADELNRTSSKTQSALLESMAEGTVTVDGQTHDLPNPFFVIATQNPLEFHGVYPLTESQLDRFMLQVFVTPPERTEELGIYGHSHGRERSAPVHSTSGLLNLERTRKLCDEAAKTYIEQSVLEYAADLVRATRTRSEIAYGVSVRGGLQFIAAAKALAFVRGRDHVRPKDVSDLAVPALAHRLCFADADPDIQRKGQVIREMLERVRAPK